MRVIFAGGGTAGHIMPAIAIAEAIQKNFAKPEILFIGRTGGNENRAIQNHGYKLCTINVKGFNRSSIYKNVDAFFKMINSSRMAKSIIIKFKPDLVIGTGGYVCYPIVKCAQRMKIPTILHESNVYPGLVTKLLSKKCSAVLLNSEGTRAYLPKLNNTFVVGNPIREAFKTLNRDIARRRLGITNNEFFILSFGGSLGAHALNECILEFINLCSTHTLNIRHIHACGSSHYPAIREKYPNLCQNKGNCRVVPYIDDMATYMWAADIVISRSGAMTLSELATAGIPSILIPLPSSAENHQLINAKYIEGLNGAIVIEEKNLNLSTLMDATNRILHDRMLRNKMRQSIRKFAPQNTEKRILDIINTII